MKRLSIIIPVYKVEKYLRTCLMSVLDQPLPKEDFEIILVNDGSPDRSIDTIYDLACLYPKTIKIINQENLGVSVARNTGLDYATGNYILFVDSDDLLRKDSLPLLLKTAEDTGADIVRGRYVELYDDQIEKLSDLSFLDNNYSSCSYSASDAYVNLFHPRFGFCWQFLISKNIISNNNLQFQPGVAFMEDFSFVIQLFLKSKRFVDTTANFYIYRKSDNSCTSTMSVNKLKSSISALEIIYNQIPFYQGKIKAKLVEDIYYNVNIIVWFLSHYKLLFPCRQIITDSLSISLKKLPRYATGKNKLILQILYLIPSIYIASRYYLSHHKF